MKANIGKRNGKMGAFGRSLFDQDTAKFTSTLTDAGLLGATVEVAHGFIVNPDPDAILNELVSTISWEQRDVTVYGKTFPQPRLVAWYGTGAYTYSGMRMEPKPMTPLLQSLQKQVEDATNHKFNSVLLNRYVAGHNHGIGQHSDDEKELGYAPVIAMLTFGEGRALDFIPKKWMLEKHPELKARSIETPAGSLLIMRGKTQNNWTHGLPKQRGKQDRVTLTFRSILK